MGMITLSAAREQRKTGRAMETSTDGAASQERDHERPRRIREAGRIIVTVGEAVYVLMEGPNESGLFAAYSEKDAYYIEFVISEDTTDLRLSA